MRLTTDQAKTIRSGIRLGIGGRPLTKPPGLRFHEQRRETDLNNSPSVTETKFSWKAREKKKGRKADRNARRASSAPPYRCGRQ